MPWFGPVAKLTWNWSLALSEWWHLRHHPWWHQLRQGLKSEFADLDPHRLVLNLRGKQHIGSLAYGETSPLSVLQILHSLQLPPATPIVDLGSGRGVPCLVAAALGHPCIGLEYFAVYTERAQRIADRWGWPARFRSGNLLHVEIPEAPLYLVSATAFPEEFREQLLEKLLHLPACQIVAQDWILPAPFVFERMQELPVSWGTAKFCYMRKQ
jgi:hypothetical protein